MGCAHACVGGVVKNIGGMAVAVGGATNHAHLLLSLSARVSPSEAVCKVRAKSSKWIHTTFPTMADFAWQEGYGAFTVSRSNVSQVAGYVENQQRHHKTMSFEEEFIELLDRHGIEYDLRHVWD